MHGGRLRSVSSSSSSSPPPRVVWLESTPQHFAPRSPSHGGVEPPSGTTARQTSSSSCGDTPRTPIDVNAQPPTELEALCATKAARRSGGGGAGPALATDCRGDWRNHIARRLARERGVPVVPLAAALASRSELHTGGAGDCTHWCEGSEATVFLAMAVLNALAAVALAPPVPPDSAHIDQEDDELKHEGQGVAQPPPAQAAVGSGSKKGSRSESDPVSALTRHSIGV
jgi:hypothetical protein